MGMAGLGAMLSWSPRMLVRSGRCCAGLPAHPAGTHRAVTLPGKGALEVTRWHPRSGLWGGPSPALPDPLCATEIRGRGTAAASSEAQPCRRASGAVPLPCLGVSPVFVGSLGHAPVPCALLSPTIPLGLRSSWSRGSAPQHSPAGSQPVGEAARSFGEASALAELGEQPAGWQGRRLGEGGGLTAVWGSGAFGAVWGIRPLPQWHRAGLPCLPRSPPARFPSPESEEHASGGEGWDFGKPVCLVGEGGWGGRGSPGPAVISSLKQASLTGAARRKLNLFVIPVNLGDGCFAG